MNDFTNPDPYVTKSHASNCRDCGQVFIVNAQYDKNGVPVSFIPKYCDECNMKPKITGNNGSWGTINNIVSAKIAQKNVEGLEDDMKRIQTKFANVFYQNAKIKKEIDVFKSSQTHFNEDQIGINFSHFALIKEIYKTLIIGFSVFVFFMLATWGYLTYTFLHK